MRMWKYSKSLPLALSLMVLSAGTASAQVAFEWPDTAVELSSYSDLERCRAAVDRAKYMEKVREFHTTGTWYDTIPSPPRQEMAPVPPSVRETARKCLVGATPEHVEVEDHRLLLPLLFEAGQGERAIELLRQRLAAFDLESDSAVLAATDTVLRVYHAVIPRPLELIDWLEETYASRIESRLERALFYRKLMGAVGGAFSDSPLDSARSYAIASRAFLVIDSLSEHEIKELARRSGALFLESAESGAEVAQRMGAFAQFLRVDQTALDSLREGTTAFIRHRKRIISRVLGQPPETIDWIGPIGHRAPEIEADVWLGCDGPCGPRPTPGRISLILIGDFTNCGRMNCLWSLIPLRRLQERFPELQTTVMARTRSSHEVLEGEAEAVEWVADLTRQTLDYYNVRAAIAASTYSYWRLPDPDLRPIYRETANEVNYSFDGRWVLEDGWEVYDGLYQFTAVLTDSDGTIIYENKLNAMNEANFAKLIEVLLEREAPNT